MSSNSWHPLRKVSRADDSSYLRYQNSNGKKNFGLFGIRFLAEAPVQVPSYTVASAPDATVAAGMMIFVTDGDTGDPTLAVSDGTDWIVVATNVAIADS